MTSVQPAAPPRPMRARVPRLGFLGVGWIGRHRLAAIRDSGAGEIAAVVDPADDVCRAVLEECPPAARFADLSALLDAELDGIVIATPSALHAAQSVAALDRGIAVFCQKPLGRTAAETRAVVDAARRADRLLGVDLSYRHTAAMQAVRGLVAAGELGRIHSIDLTFHNAYGPDKPWFRDPAQSGGGCVMDLGIHLVDLALWLLDWPAVRSASGRLLAGGAPIARGSGEVEDFATATLDLAGDVAVRLACSWNLPAGRDAVIETVLYGTRGGAAVRNVDGSFYDFVAERYSGTSTEVLAAPPDDWGGRAAVAWAERLARDPGFDPAAERLVDVAAALDAVYGG